MDKKTCTISWCDNKQMACGYCAGHYHRSRKGQDMNKPFRKGRQLGACKVANCEDNAIARDLCKFHYNRDQAGYPLTAAPKRRSPVQTVEGRLAFYSDPKDPDTGCINWNGCKTKGYGTISVGNQRQRNAHTVAWEIANGKELPDGLVVRHTCDNPPCVNPDHLIVGTHADNVNDKVSRDRQCKGADNGMAVLTDEQVKQIRIDLAGGESQYQIAKRFGVSQSLISLINLRKLWVHLD